MQSLTPDPDEDVDPRQIEAVVTEEAPDSGLAPEENGKTSLISEWDEVPGASGESAPKVGMEDEVPVAEILVNEGIEEADRDQRLAAVDPDFVP